MKRTRIYLPDEIHSGLRKMAFENNTSVAELIRRAVDAAYREDIEDIMVVEEEFAYYKAHPESAVSLEEALRQEKQLKPKGC